MKGDILSAMKAKIPWRLLPYVPAILLSGLSLCLLLIRMLAAGNSRFSFMAWNLFLAWLPLLFAHLLQKGLRTSRWLSLKNALFSLLWLTFLPNSFYLVTDFIHLRGASLDSAVFDAVMFMSFALAGLILGCMSVYLLHRQLARRLAYDMTWAFLLACFLLSAVAIYLGRYLSWNSWDLVINPFYILLDLSDRLTSRSGLSLTFETTMLFFSFITVSYIGFYSAVKAARTSK